MIQYHYRWTLLVNVFHVLVYSLIWWIFILFFKNFVYVPFSIIFPRKKLEFVRHRPDLQKGPVIVVATSRQSDTELMTIKDSHVHWESGREVGFLGERELEIHRYQLCFRWIVTIHAYGLFMWYRGFHGLFPYFFFPLNKNF